jgi:hypothetical protein
MPFNNFSFHNTMCKATYNTIQNSNLLYVMEENKLILSNVNYSEEHYV